MCDAAYVFFSNCAWTFKAQKDQYNMSPKVRVWPSCNASLLWCGVSFDCRKVVLPQKNIFFSSLYCPRLQYKGRRLPFPTPWDANITFFRASFSVPGLGPISFEFDLAIALEILIHREDSPSWRKKMVLCAKRSLKSGCEYCSLSSNAAHRK